MRGSPTPPTTYPTAAQGHEERFPPPTLSGRRRFSQGTFAGTRGNGRDAPIPAVRMTTGSARVDPKPTSTAAGHGLLTALTLTAMGRLPKVLLAIKSADRRARRR